MEVNAGTVIALLTSLILILLYDRFFGPRRTPPEVEDELTATQRALAQMVIRGRTLSPERAAPPRARTPLPTASGFLGQDEPMPPFFKQESLKGELPGGIGPTLSSISQRPLKESTPLHRGEDRSRTATESESPPPVQAQRLSRSASRSRYRSPTPMPPPSTPLGSDSDDSLSSASTADTLPKSSKRSSSVARGKSVAHRTLASAPAVKTRNQNQSATTSNRVPQIDFQSIPQPSGSKSVSAPGTRAMSESDRSQSMFASIMYDSDDDEDVDISHGGEGSFKRCSQRCPLKPADKEAYRQENKEPPRTSWFSDRSDTPRDAPPALSQLHRIQDSDLFVHYHGTNVQTWLYRKDRVGDKQWKSIRPGYKRFDGRRLHFSNSKICRPSWVKEDYYWKSVTKLELARK